MRSPRLMQCTMDLCVVKADGFIEKRINKQNERSYQFKINDTASGYEQKRSAELMMFPIRFEGLRNLHFNFITEIPSSLNEEQFYLEVLIQNESGRSRKLYDDVIKIDHILTQLTRMVDVDLDDLVAKNRNDPAKIGMFLISVKCRFCHVGSSITLYNFRFSPCEYECRR
ncbi:hypothetical protein SSS_04429 [Sarcoptes scabiei]|uniref:Uncharacterized protein n=1 Tax=Sarcoptes scabiei TaxID=52283 RepID=A0A834RBW2_SARSC|nr:hypothetical protein SSS_04429 [Sarcoptes scabiei]